MGHILDPSRKIDDAYRTEVLWTKSGRILAGQVVREDERSLWIAEDPYRQREPIEVARDDVDERASSATSAMPLGLLSTFTREEILHLLAYLESVAAAR